MRTRMSFILALALTATPAIAGGANTPPAPSKFNVVPLVSDQAGVAPNTDPDLVNAWGISQQGNGPLWISDNGTGLSTVYDVNTGVKQFGVTIPSGVPTGTVGVSSPNGFVIKEGTTKGPSYFMFDSESGQITGWSPVVDFANAIVAVDNSGQGSVYKGLALDEADSLLFAADFHNNQVQIYDSGFNQSAHSRILACRNVLHLSTSRSSTTSSMSLLQNARRTVAMKSTRRAWASSTCSTRMAIFCSI